MANFLLATLVKIIKYLVTVLELVVAMGGKKKRGGPSVAPLVPPSSGKATLAFV